MRRVPKFLVALFGSSHAFRSKKRKEARAALKAINKLRGGCAYFPGGNFDANLAEEAIIRVIKDISSRNWGR